MSLESKKSHLPINKRDFLKLTVLGLLAGSATGLGLGQCQMKFEKADTTYRLNFLLSVV